MEQFLKEVLRDLNQSPKSLNSKYFYDEAGDKLFQQIMGSVEYYPTNCEMEIFKTRTKELALTLKNGFAEFDLVELGAGDATKSSYLLAELHEQGADFTYMPIDISSSMVNYLEKNLPNAIPGLKVTGLNGEYFEMLQKAYAISSRKKVVLFLGGNIGNFKPDEALDFCKRLRTLLKPDDLLLIGFDLKKHPRVIRAAYNDAAGYTRDFNLNLLKRINRELKGNFILSQFEHYPSYDPSTGACRSYLISLTDQVVNISDHTFHFKENEYIDMEISQKYSVEETDAIARAAGFKPIAHFYDSKKWFLDTVWSGV
ncbi:L-histidine N(alpha)-methyltransferase [Pedobacter sp. MC2016-14]|uniref:L-histidine N(alpha)-methyltransferase n=1 Tax=Pedobacter sp. MC2016-14 TaxID=2897327 RepID=UPI001E632FA4|nr:L-histidine N(alpha)-methyltransferase [Pedobacter sp. MC2016-14]MCD0490237.1 L-histidine N(alpha)-methyltransferase [Pedobacter sp. MC2016-14]